MLITALRETTFSKVLGSLGRPRSTRHFENVFRFALVLFLIFVFVPTVRAEGTLAVSAVSAEKTYARAGGEFDDGWKWILSVNVPDNEPVLQMKFSNWTNALGGVFSSSGNVRFYSAQSSNASDSAHAISITFDDTYSSVINLLPASNPSSDLDALTPGRQIQIVLEAKIPSSAAGGSYSTSFGITTNPDTNPPALSLVGASSVTIEKGAFYVELGASALDNIDGAIATSGVLVSGSVTTGSIGTYILTYSVSDSAGNAAMPITRTVLVQDTIVPTGTVSYSTTAPTNQNVTATLSPSEQVVYLNTNGMATTTEGGATTEFTQNGNFTFLFADVANNMGSTIASVSNIDKTAPTIASSLLNGVNASVAVNINNTPVTISLTASESVNWLSIKIEKDGDANVYKTYQSGSSPCADWTSACEKVWSGELTQGALSDGVYKIKVRARDVAGNEVDGYLGKTITVDTTAPVITLNGNATVTHNLGAEYTDAGATTNDGSTAVPSGSVDKNTVGDYVITYTATDSVGNVSESVTRTVQVRIFVESITISSGGRTTLNMTGGDTVQMSVVSILPSTATNQTYTWYVVNAGGAAEIGQNGILFPGSSPRQGFVDVYVRAGDSSGIQSNIIRIQVLDQ